MSDAKHSGDKHSEPRVFDLPELDGPTPNVDRCVKVLMVGGKYYDFTPAEVAQALERLFWRERKQISGLLTLLAKARAERDAALSSKGSDDQLYAALLELVQCKDLIDCVESERKNPDSLLTLEHIASMEDDYKRRKPLAWEAARKAVVACVPSSIERDAVIEECAKVCDALRAKWDTPLGTSTWKHAFEDAAKEIRALKEARPEEGKTSG